jgi:hypothetical protein
MLLLMSIQTGTSRTGVLRAWVLGLLILAVLAGCETLGQDVNDLASAINPIRPFDAAQMMVDPFSADNRRQGTTLISNAPFGGVDLYVAMYREMTLNEQDPIVKATAIRALARHGEPADALRIVPHLAHETTQVRWEAAKGLQRLHNPASVADLLKVLRNEIEQVDVRVACAIALGQYPEDRVFQGLVAALDARELALNAAAERSLTTLTGKSFDMDARSWLRWYNSLPPGENAFSGRQDFLYPTYQREDSFWEMLAFWTSRNFETPAPPAGLRAKSERSTYEDDASAAETPASTGS